MASLASASWRRGVIACGHFNGYYSLFLRLALVETEPERTERFFLTVEFDHFIGQDVDYFDAIHAAVEDEVARFIEDDVEA